jgi:ubiquinone/menaquinone biosynthesis C-methylase UbiE
MGNNTPTSVRKSYDRVAAEYARNLFHELENKPLDRALLDRFAAETTGRGPVCDMGCGPGDIARYLHDARASVFGLDLSPQMLEQARQLNPDITFTEGDIFALNFETNSLAGIAAFYAIVNLPPESLPLAFSEMQRVLQPEALLLLAFHTGQQVIHVDEMWEQPVSMDFFYFEPAAIRHMLETAGFTIEEIIEREPYAPRSSTKAAGPTSSPASRFVEVIVPRSAPPTYKRKKMPGAPAPVQKQIWVPHSGPPLARVGSTESRTHPTERVQRTRPFANSQAAPHLAFEMWDQQHPHQSFSLTC